jgi:hypothetical protein
MAVLVGIATTVTLVVVHNGLLIANGARRRFAVAQLSRAGRHLVRDAPSFVGFQDRVSVPWIASAIWIAIAAVAWRVSGGLDAANPGRAALAASGVGLCALVAAAIVVPVAVGREPPARRAGRGALAGRGARRLRRGGAPAGNRVRAVPAHFAG